MVYTSTNGFIELRIVGYDEPNNGRELHIAELYIKGENVSDTYFTNKWNRLNLNLNHFIFESPDSNYVFIPAEGDSFVISTKSFQKYHLPTKELSTIYFLKNEFEKTKLTVYYTDEIVEIILI